MFVRTLSLSNVITFFEMAYLASTHTDITIFNLRGHVTSSIMWPFDTEYAISYKCSLYCDRVCMRDPAVFEIMDPNILGSRPWPWPFKVTWRHRSRVQSIPYSYFLLVVHWYRGFISNRFRDIWPQNPVRTHRKTHAASNFTFCPMQCIICIALDRQSPTVTKLCHIKCDHQRAFRSMVSIFSIICSVHIIYDVNWVVARNMS